MRPKAGFSRYLNFRVFQQNRRRAVIANRVRKRRETWQFAGIPVIRERPSSAEAVRLRIRSRPLKMSAASADTGRASSDYQALARRCPIFVTLTPLRVRRVRA
jgi:hypothetical protein